MEAHRRRKAADKHRENSVNAKGTRWARVLIDPSPALSYVIGCYLSDGCISEYRGQCQFILSTTDEPYARSIEAAWALLGRKPYVRREQRKIQQDCINSGFFSEQTERKPNWRVVVGCRDLHLWVKSHTLDELLDLGLTHPWDLLRGLYEGDGSVFWKRGRKGQLSRLALTVLFNTDLEVIERVRSWLAANGFHPCVYTKTSGRKQPISEIRLGRQPEIRRFLENANPCIKTMPRSHVNTEPIPPTHGGQV